ncbi:4-hydroxy-3-methylbut-2-enyl diphosphate reductase [Candidatus Daviesbacteria bacterium]|nr:4-hydroxy-3-methylbut-2-enyl diphosphate reductase [Candidatus Daviesbacteria bacterium]
MSEETQKIAYKAYPLGFCAGVAWSIDNAKRALNDGPVTGLGNLVNNFPVVHSLEARGMTFVEDPVYIPEGARVMISAHGLSESERRLLRDKKTQIIDSTCPLVAKVHERVKRAKEIAVAEGRDWDVLYICKDLEHREPKGVIGEAPDNITPIRTEEDVKDFVPVPGKMYFIDTQTTLNTGKALAWIDRLREKIPDIRIPDLGDVCFATQNRQGALGLVLAREPQVMIAFGSRISSNTSELVKMGKAAGAEVYLVETAEEVQRGMFEGASRVAVTAGASADPMHADKFMRQLSVGGYKIEDLRFGKPEPVNFNIPPRVEDYRNT